MAFFKPLGDRVLVRPDYDHDEHLDRGEVLAMGAAVRAAEIDLDAGNTVYYEPESGLVIPLRGEELLLLREHELLGAVR